MELLYKIKKQCDDQAVTLILNLSELEYAAVKVEVYWRGMYA